MRSKFGQPILCIFKQSFDLSFDFWIMWFFLCSKNKGNAYLSKKNKKKIILLYSSKFDMCTSLIETLQFLFVIVVLPFIFANDAIICLTNYGRLLYFQKWTYVLPIVDTCTSCSHTFVLPFRWFYYISSTFMWNMYFQNWTFLLPSTWFIIFLAFHVKDALPKLNILYFYIIAYTSHSHSFVLPYITAYISRFRSFVLPFR
jgi:hypothetical protein